MLILFWGTLRITVASYLLILDSLNLSLWSILLRMLVLSLELFVLRHLIQLILDSIQRNVVLFIRTYLRGRRGGDVPVSLKQILVLLFQIGSQQAWKYVILLLEHFVVLSHLVILVSYLVCQLLLDLNLLLYIFDEFKLLLVILILVVSQGW
jgi:hypothetical protein